MCSFFLPLLFSSLIFFFLWFFFFFLFPFFSLYLSLYSCSLSLSPFLLLTTSHKAIANWFARLELDRTGNEHEWINSAKVDAARQQDGYNCGVFVVLYAKAALAGVDSRELLRALPGGVDAHRRLLLAELVNGHIEWPERCDVMND